MESRSFGVQAKRVSVLGFGAGQIGGGDLGESEVERLLNAVLDEGITFIDTARSYGLSEERIGRYLGHRRGEFTLSTKGGYGIEGVADWTGEAISRGIDQALARLQTDHVDVFHLHSCPTETMLRQDITEALSRARAAGKIGMAAYSGENESLAAALSSPHFDAVQTSVNPFDQRSLAIIGGARDRPMGVIGKRPLANACWQFQARPNGNYAEVYWDRMQAMGIDRGEYEWDELALRFSAFAPGVSSVIPGTKSLVRLRRNRAIVEKGPLPPEVTERLVRAFQRADRDWVGQI